MGNRHSDSFSRKLRMVLDCVNHCQEHAEEAHPAVRSKIVDRLRSISELARQAIVMEASREGAEQTIAAIDEWRSSWTE